MFLYFLLAGHRFEWLLAMWAPVSSSAPPSGSDGPAASVSAHAPPSPGAHQAAVPLPAAAGRRHGQHPLSGLQPLSVPDLRPRHERHPRAAHHVGASPLRSTPPRSPRPVWPACLFPQGAERLRQEAEARGRRAADHPQHPAGGGGAPRRQVPGEPGPVVLQQQRHRAPHLQAGWELGFNPGWASTQESVRSDLISSSLIKISY